MSDTKEREGGRVVVGVDGSSGSVHALAWAGREARVRNATLEVVAAWTYPTLVLLVPVAPDPPQVKALRKHARDMIEGDLEKVADDVTGVQVDVQILEGDTSAVLLERARGADLLVVGSRGLGGFRGLLLGSVSQQCVQHATSPVVVVPSPDES